MMLASMGHDAGKPPKGARVARRLHLVRRAERNLMSYERTGAESSFRVQLADALVSKWWPRPGKKQSTVCKAPPVLWLQAGSMASRPS